VVAARGLLDRQIVPSAIADVAVPSQDRAGDALGAQCIEHSAYVWQAAVIDDIEGNWQTSSAGVYHLAGGAKTGERARQLRKVRPIDHDGYGQPFKLGTRRAYSIHVIWNCVSYGRHFVVWPQQTRSLLKFRQFGNWPFLLLRAVTFGHTPFILTEPRGCAAKSTDFPPVRLCAIS
jgi:hypothetical protein